MRTLSRVCLSVFALFVTSLLGNSCDAAVITPTSASTNNQFGGVGSGVPADNTRNSSGFNGVQHSASLGDMWLTNNLGPYTGETWQAALDAVVIEWNLGASYNLTNLYLWNQNEPGNLNRGVASAVIDISNFADFSSPTIINLSFSPGTGLATYTGEGYGLVATGQYVRFRNMTKFAHPEVGDPNQYLGLSEIRFEGTAALIPEPSSLLLIGSAAVGVVRVVRRRRHD